MTQHQTSPLRMPRYPSLSQLMTRGTFYDVGYNVGLQFEHSIRHYFAESDTIQKKLLPFYDSHVGREYYEKSLKVSMDCFPQYVREVRGTADGAGFPFEHLFMANVSREVSSVLYPNWMGIANRQPGATVLAKVPSAEDTIRTLSDQFNNVKGPSGKDTRSDPAPHIPDNFNSSNQSHHTHKNTTTCTTTIRPPATEQPFQENSGCSDVFINRAGYPQYIIHNEDNDPLIKAYGYLLNAEIEEDGEKEQFTSFCYPGFLPGSAFSFNFHGLSISVNGLYPDHVVEEAPSRFFVNRSLLRARSPEDAVRLARNEPWGVAYGFCANLSTRDGTLVSMEVAPGKPRGLVHVQYVEQAVGDSEAECHYYHFNSYKHLTEVPEIQGLKSSLGRTQRASELPPPHMLEEALLVMADMHDPLYPIFRRSRPTDESETICTAVFNVTARQVCLYQGREDLLSDLPFARLAMY